MRTYNREEFWLEAKKNSPDLSWADFLRRWNATWALALAMGVAQKCDPSPTN